MRFFEGNGGAERKVEDFSGKVEFYEGRRGAERLVRKENPDGEVKFYEGERGAERKMRAEHLDTSSGAIGDVTSAHVSFC